MTNTEKLCVNCEHEKKLHLSKEGEKKYGWLCGVGACRCGKFRPVPAIPEAGKCPCLCHSENGGAGLLKNGCPRCGCNPPTAPLSDTREELGTLVRDFCSVVPRSKSEVRRRIQEFVAAELAAAKKEAYDAGRAWDKYAGEGVKELIAQSRAEVLKEIIAAGEKLLEDIRKWRGPVNKYQFSDAFKKFLKSLQ